MIQRNLFLADYIEEKGPVTPTRFKTALDLLNREKKKVTCSVNFGGYTTLIYSFD